MKPLVSLLAFAALAAGASAENYGNETFSVGNDVVVKFTSSGTFVLDHPATVRVLVVGGGGAGGTGIGGGGGGGGEGHGTTRGLQAAIPGVDGLGGGGSGGTNGANKNGGRGGSGVVVIRWSDPDGTIILVK